MQISAIGQLKSCICNVLEDRPAKVEADSSYFFDRCSLGAA